MAIALSGSSDGNNIAGSSSQILSSENKKAASGGEMVGGCSVCSDDQGTDRNLLVYCDSCDVAVHQACYGIISVPSGNWFCRKCESGDSQNKIKCELCPSKDGAFKKTETGSWAHVVCALYIPEVRFGNNNTMEPIEIKHIQADRYNKTCYLCEEAGNSVAATYGAVMNCHKTGCKQSFHVTCAQTAGLLCEEGGQGSERVNYCGYCKHHFRKLKAGSRKNGGNSLNNSNSSYADSASDSSQDNDSRCNRTEQDKSSNRTTNKLPTLPTNLSMSDAMANNNSNSVASSSAAATPSKIATTTLTPDNAPISLTIPLNSTSGTQNKTSAFSSSSANASQKKKRTSRMNPTNSTSSSSANNSSSTTLLATAGSLPPNSLGAQSSTASLPVSTSLNTMPAETSKPQDVYNWSSKDASVNNKISSGGGGGGGKKKPNTTTTTSNTPSSSSSAKQPSANQAISMTNYNLQKIGSPNLSLSTSPSLTSPSSVSTKSTSNSSNSSISTTTAHSSSSSSTSSNSPSPALLSPNISTNRGATARLESPLASNSKTGNNNLHNRPLTEYVSHSNALPIGQQNSLQTRISLGNSTKNNSKQDPMASSSLLSTAVPHEQLANPIPGSSSTTINKVSSKTMTEIATPTIQTSFPNLSVANNPMSIGSSTNPPGSSGNYSATTKNSNTQPTVPPLIIPVPQAASNNSSNTATKPTAKGKANAKGTRKKSTELNETPSKPEPKPKASRSKKATAVNNNTSETSRPKPEPAKRGKGKTPSTKAADNTSVAPAGSLDIDGGRTIAASTKNSAGPNKRKSRSASNESNAVVASAAVGSAPSPAKRPRKKKADQQTVAQSTDKPTAAGSIALHNVNNLQLPASNTTLGTSPLTINTPMMNNRLMQGINSVEGNDIANRPPYFSPMVSPYANFDHLNAPSLSRASLSRLFTSSSVDNNQAGPSDDIGRAFEELRENTWTHLSKYILEQASQFDIPSLIGTLYAFRSENEKMENKVRDLTMKREQMIAISARLDLPGPMLTQHLNTTSPNFSSVVSSLANSPKNLPTSSPGSAINKQPLISGGSYNHMPPGSLGPPGYPDRSSPLVSQTHSGINNIKSSSISTPSPPIGALMAHSTSNRAGLITVNPPYIPNVFPQMNSLAQLGTNHPQGSSYYPRQ